MRQLRPYQVVLVLCAAYLLFVAWTNPTGLMSFVTIGACYADCDGNACPLGAADEGYDGQFAYYIARDPLAAQPCIDLPAYRYQRILLPLFGTIFSFGNDALIPIIFVLVNLAALVIATALLEDLLVSQRLSRWFALGYGAFAGLWLGVRLSTPEPLAYGLIVAAVWIHQRRVIVRDEPSIGAWRWLWLLCLALAPLAKETALLFVAGWILYYAVRRGWGVFLRVIFAVVPFLLWEAVLFFWLGSVGVGSGGVGGTAFEWLPFGGIVRIFTEGMAMSAVSLNGNVQAVWATGGIAIMTGALPSLALLWLSGRDLWRKRDEASLFTYLLFLNALIMLFVPFSTYREVLGVLRFLPGLVLAHLLFGTLPPYRGRVLGYSILWAALVIGIFFFVAS
jgi:hypothetical protein